MVQDCKTKQSGFAGTLKNLHLIDIVQLCCLSSTTMVIKVAKDALEGTVFIDNGEVVHALQGDSVGTEAFYTIMGWDSGLFETFSPEQIPPRTIREHYQFLLMEASRRIDEHAEHAREERPEVIEEKINVLIVDDSPIMAKILTTLFTAQGDIRIVGVARNGQQAIDMIDRTKPDLIALDVNMPVMDGSTALKHIMIKKPCPVVVMSNLGDSSQANVLRFLDLGAVDFLSKPVRHKNILLQQDRIIQRLRRCAKSNIHTFRRTLLPKPVPVEEKLHGDPAGCRQLLVINSGATAPAALLRLLGDLAEKTTVGIVLLIALPPPLIAPLAEFLDRRCRYRVAAIEGPQRIHSNQVLVGTTGAYAQLVLERDGHWLHPVAEEVGIASGKTCFDLFLTSAAEHFAARVGIVLLSGADIQSLDGLERIESVGGAIVIQDRATCTMVEPLEWVDRSDLVSSEIPLMRIGDYFRTYAGEDNSWRASLG